MMPEAQAKQWLLDALAESDAARYLRVPAHRSFAINSQTSEQLADMLSPCKELCYPVVLKIQSIDQELVQHKSDVGGVVLNIEESFW